MADALRQGPRTLASDFHEARVAGDLLEQRKGTLRLGENAFVEVRLELHKSIVHAQAVVLHAALQQFHKLLLARQPLANLQELHGRGVQRVVEFHFEGFGAILPAKRFFAQVGDLAVDIEVQTLEEIESGRSE